MRSPFLKHTPYLILMIILAGALLLRSAPYFEGDFTYFLDQSRDLLLTQQIVEHKDITLIGARSGIGGIFHGPLWLYMITPFYFFAQGDPFFTLIPLFLIVNLLPIALAFYIGKSLFNTYVGLLWSFFLAISKPFINTSFTTSNAQVMPLLFLLFLWASLSYLKPKKSPYLISIMLFLTGLSFHFESAFAIFLIPLTVLVILLKKTFPPARPLFLGFLLAVISVSNFILFELKNAFLMTKSLMKLVTGTMESTYLQEFTKDDTLFSRIGDRIILLKDYFFMPFFESSLVIGMSAFMIILVSVFVFFTRKHNSHILNTKQCVFIMSIPFLFSALYTLYPYPLWPHYIIALVIPASLLISLSLALIHEQTKKPILIVVFLGMTCIAPISWLVQNYVLQEKTTEHRTYLRQKNVVDFIFEDAGKSNEIGYFVYDSGFLTYNFDYLMTHGGKTRGVSTINKKTPYTYVILGPAPQWDKGAHVWWLEHVLNTKGEVVLTRDFEEGVRLMKLKIQEGEPDPDPNYFQNLIFR